MKPLITSRFFASSGNSASRLSKSLIAEKSRFRNSHSKRKTTFQRRPRRGIYNIAMSTWQRPSRDVKIKQIIRSFADPLMTTF